MTINPLITYIFFKCQKCLFVEFVVYDSQKKKKNKGDWKMFGFVVY